MATEPDKRPVDADCHSEALRAVVQEHNRLLDFVLAQAQGRSVPEARMPRKIVVTGQVTIDTKE